MYLDVLYWYLGVFGMYLGVFGVYLDVFLANQGHWGKPRSLVETKVFGASLVFGQTEAIG